MSVQCNTTRQNIVVWVANSASKDGVYPVLRTQDISADSGTRTTTIDIGIPPATQKLRAVRIGWKFASPEKAFKALCVISTSNMIEQSNSTSPNNLPGPCRLVEEDKIYDTGLRTLRYWKIDTEHGIAGSEVLATASLEFYRLKKDIPGSISHGLEYEDGKKISTDDLKKSLGVNKEPSFIFQFVFKLGSLSDQSQVKSPVIPRGVATTSLKSQPAQAQLEIDNTSAKRRRDSIEIEDTPPPEDVPVLEVGLQQRGPSKRLKAMVSNNTQPSDILSRTPVGPKKHESSQSIGPSTPTTSPKTPQVDAMEALRRLEQLDNEKERLQVEINSLLQVRQAEVDTLKNVLAMHTKS